MNGKLIEIGHIIFLNFILITISLFMLIASKSIAFADSASRISALVAMDSQLGGISALVRLRNQVEEAAKKNENDELALAALGELFAIAQNVGHTVANSQGLIDQLAINNQGLKSIVDLIDDFDAQGVSQLSIHYEFAEKSMASMNNDIIKLNNFRALGNLVEQIGKYGGGAITAASYTNQLNEYRKDVKAGRADIVSHMTIVKDGFRSVTETYFPPSSTAFTLLDDVLIKMVVLPSSDWVGDQISDRRTAAATEVANILSSSNENLRRRIRDLALTGGGTSQRDVEAIVREVNGDLYRKLFAMKDIVDSSWTSEDAKVTYERITKRALEEMLNPSQRRISAALLLLDKFSNMITTANTLPNILNTGTTITEDALGSMPEPVEYNLWATDEAPYIAPDDSNNTGIVDPFSGDDDNSDRNDEDKVAIGDDTPPEETGPTAEEIAAQEALEAEQAAADAEARLQQIAQLRTARDSLSLTQSDAEVRLQERRNRLTVLQFNELEKVQNAGTIVRNRISELRVEQNDSGLSAADQQLLLDLVRYEDRLQTEQERIAGDIISAQSAILTYESALSQATSQLATNAASLANFGDDLSDYTPPVFVPSGLTDWTTYEYELPAFNETELPTSDLTNVVVSTVSLPVTSGNIRKSGAIISEDGSSIRYDVWGVDEARSKKLDDFEHLYYGTGTDGLQWIYGEASTPEQFALRTGTATFNGGLSGYYAHGTLNANTVYADSVTGGLALNIDFGSNRLTGEGRIEINNAARMETLSFSLNESAITETGGLTRSLGFNTSATLANGASGNGNFSGTFYGSDASEAAGSFAFGLSGGFAAGLWAAGENYVPGDGNEQNAYSGAFILEYTSENDGSGYGTAWREVGEINGGEILISGGSSGSSGSVNVSSTLPSNGFSHVSWGTWAENSSTPSDLSDGGIWVDVDNVTASAVLQGRTGSAQYAGEILGGYVSGGNIEEDAQGIINITADFSNQSVGGQFQFGRSCSGSGLSGCSVASEVQSFNEPMDDYDGSGFGNHARVGNSGVIGVFGGESGQEIGGHAWIEEDNGQYVGVFRAREGLSFGDFANLTAGVAEGDSGNTSGGDNSGFQIYSNYRGLYAFSGRELVSGDFVTNFASVTTISNDGNIGIEGTSGTPNISDNLGAEDQYNYVSWGQWSAAEGGDLTINADGEETTFASGSWLVYDPTTDLPTSGSATYNGFVNGRVAGGDTLGGTIDLNADFAADRVTGSMDIVDSAGSYANANFDTSIRRDTDSSGFQGALTGSEVDSGAIFGGFAGPSAEEVGGGWQIDHTDGSNANGIFRALQ